MDSFEKSVERFITAATWLDETDVPMVTALQQAARELDANGVQAALLNTFGVTYRHLYRRRKEVTGQEFDDDESFLNAL